MLILRGGIGRRRSRMGQEDSAQVIASNQKQGSLLMLGANPNRTNKFIREW